MENAKSPSSPSKSGWRQGWRYEAGGRAYNEWPLIVVAKARAASKVRPKGGRTSPRACLGIRESAK